MAACREAQDGGLDSGGLSAFPSVSLAAHAKGQANTKSSVITCSCVCFGTVDVKVVDKKGNDVIGLRVQNFAIYDNGAIQEVIGLEENSANRKNKSARYTILYTPGHSTFDGKYHKLRAVVKSADDRKYKAIVFPKGYNAIAKRVPCNDLRDR
ncbi:MAG TPA: hypothetical protein VJ810_01570 [Blastocatellia bacterium]|nr:hypothetical protein [Blastocatellia bacterium]